MPDTTPDPVAERLAYLRSRHYRIPDPSILGNAAGICESDRHRWPCHASTLLDVADEVLKLHNPGGRRSELVRCEKHRLWAGVGLDRYAITMCPDCRMVETVICWQKGCEEYGWPCPTYEAVRRGLPGKEADGG